MPFSPMQKFCSFFQLLRPGSSTLSASLSLLGCTGHWGVQRMQSLPECTYNCKVLRCTNCSGCKECRQPLPLVIPEGTGGSGCSAEVAAQAEALHAQVQHRIGEQDEQGVEGAAGSSNRASESAASTSNNPALVECACAIASQGTLVYLPPSSCVEGAKVCATAALSVRGRTGSWGTRRCASSLYICTSVFQTFDRPLDLKASVSGDGLCLYWVTPFDSLWRDAVTRIKLWSSEAFHVWLACVII
jgi:hypothetical protein